MHPQWTFSTLVKPDRVARLEAVTGFDDIIKAVRAGKISGFREEARSDMAAPCRRASFTIEVDETTFDAFFNAPRGYRGQYCVSHANGDARNARLVRALSQACAEFVAEAGPQWDFIKASLAGQDAKMWIFERDVHVVDRVPKILHQPWLERALAIDDSQYSRQVRAAALLGVMAPLGTRLDLKGAWILPGGSEWRDPTKENRATEIAECGFTRSKPALEFVRTHVLEDIPSEPIPAPRRRLG